MSDIKRLTLLQRTKLSPEQLGTAVIKMARIFQERKEDSRITAMRMIKKQVLTAREYHTQKMIKWALTPITKEEWKNLSNEETALRTSYQMIAALRDPANHGKTI